MSNLIRKIKLIRGGKPTMSDKSTDEILLGRLLKE